MPGIFLGLAETLRQELLLYSIDVQIYFPVTIYTPGYEEENKTKPQLVLKLEESDPGITAEKAAEGLYEGAVLSQSLSPAPGPKTIIYAGMRKGDFHITDTFIGDVFRTNTRGSSPFGSNVLKDLLFGLIGAVRLCAPVNGCNLDMNRVDCPHAMAARCGQASRGSQKGSFRISGIEESTGTRMISSYMYATVYESVVVDEGTIQYNPALVRITNV